MSGKSGKKKPQDKKTAGNKKSQDRAPKGKKQSAANAKPAAKGGFGISIGEVFSTGLQGYFPNAIIMTLAGLPVLIVFAVLSRPFTNFQGMLQDRVDAGELTSISVIDGLSWVGLLMVAAIPAGAVALPWFKYALDIVDKKDINVMAPLIDFQKFANHAFATFWFWAGIAFGLRYLRGIPSILVILLYAFYAYVIADGKQINGLKALGVSVRLGTGRRIGLFAIAGMFFMFNIFGLLGLAVGLEDGSPSLLGIALGILGLSATASVTLISGAAIFRVLEGNLQ